MKKKYLWGLVLSSLFAGSFDNSLLARETCMTRADGARLVCPDGFHCERKGDSFDCVVHLQRDIQNTAPPELGGKQVVTLLNSTSKPLPAARDLKGRVVNPPAARSQTLERISREQSRAKLIKEITSRIVKTGASQRARDEADRVMRKMLKDVPDSVLKNIVDSGYKIYIIPKGKKLVDLPDFAFLKGQKTFDGRTWDDVGGVMSSGAKGLAVQESDLLGGASGYEKRQIFTHEFGHLIAAADPGLNAQIQQNYNQKMKSGGGFSDDYAAANKDEYFARSTEMWFEVYPNNTWNPFSDPKGKGWLRQNDPAMYQTLSNLYG